MFNFVAFRNMAKQKTERLERELTTLAVANVNSLGDSDLTIASVSVELPKIKVYAYTNTFKKKDDIQTYVTRKFARFGFVPTIVEMANKKDSVTFILEFNLKDR